MSELCDPKAYNRGWQIFLPRLRQVKFYWPTSPLMPLPWTSYKYWAFTLISSYSQSSLVRAPLCFYFNLERLQPHFALLRAGSQAYKTYSFGYLLKLYFIQTKRTRRDVKRLTLALSFFKKYFSARFRAQKTVLVINGYKKRYSLFLSTSVIPFAYKYCETAVFLPKVLRGFFFFRRVKGVKKRIRKRLKAQKLN